MTKQSEQRAQNREDSLKQSLDALQESWGLLDEALSYVPDSPLRSAMLAWLKQHILWSPSLETIDDDVAWLHKHDLEP
jgi:hypothetical protein